MTVTFLQVGEPGSVGSQVVIEGDCRRVSALRPAGGTGEVAQGADYDGRLFAMRRPLRAHIGCGDAVNAAPLNPESDSAAPIPPRGTIYRPERWNLY
jgi:hypothetical protein